MHDAVSMHGVDADTNLQEHSRDCFGIDDLVVLDVLIQVTPVYILCNDTQALSVNKKVIAPEQELTTVGKKYLDLR